MIEQLSPTWLKAGVSRQCQANRHCAMEGPSFAVPFVSVGRPDGRLTVACEVCGVFACGGCAKRDALRLRLGGLDIFAWRLACPLCGSVLGDPQPHRAILHSSHLGQLAVLDTSVAPWKLENKSAVDAIRPALPHHEHKALRLLYLFNTQSSMGGVIRLSELAVEESPGEGVAWLYVALLCAKAGYPLASRHALKELAALTNDSNIAQRPGLATLRHLQLMPDDATLDDVRLDELSKRLTDYDTRLVERAGKLFNADLAQYHGFVRSYFDGKVPPDEAVKQLFFVRTPTTPAISAYLNAYEVERSIDLSEVTKERERFVTTLTNVVDDDEVTEMVAQAMAQRLGRLSESDYYKYLQQLAEKHEVTLSDYPQFDAYCEYMSVADGIETAAFHGDMWDGVRAGYGRRIQTAEERSLVEEATRVRLIARILHFCRGRGGGKRETKTSAPSTAVLEELMKELAAATEKPPESFWRRFLPGRGFWQRLVSKRSKT